MRVIRAIAVREFKSQYAHLSGWFLFALLSAFSGAMFYLGNLSAASARLDDTAQNLAVLIFLFAPLFSVRSFTEERKNMTLDLMISQPVSIFQFVAGKYLSAMMQFILFFIFLFTFPVVLSIHADVYWPLIFTQYAALLLAGMTVTAAGLLFSSMFENVLAAAAVSTVFFLILLMLSSAAETANGLVRLLLVEASMLPKLNSFFGGFADVRSAAYFVLLTVLFLALTIKVLERQYWSRS